MGSGGWTTTTYTDRTSAKSAAGVDTFAYDSTVKASPYGTWKAHPSLDPKWLNSFGQKIRESRDSDEHPESQAVAVLFDVTGSMGYIPRTVQTKLPELYGLLLRKGYLEHPQLLFGAIGDATCDQVPLQVGQFESDNRADENLENFVLEGGGGGQRTESYELAVYFMARHTSLDCYEKREKRGYLFIVGDEMNYSSVYKKYAASVIGDTLEADIPTKQIYEELQEKYEVFYILPKGASYGGDKTILAHWKDILGENVLELDDANAVSEVIAMIIGMREGVIDMDAGISDLEDLGVPKSTIRSASTAVAKVGASSSAVARVSGGDLISAGSSGVDRL